MAAGAFCISLSFGMLSAFGLTPTQSTYNSASTQTYTNPQTWQNAISPPNQNSWTNYVPGLDLLTGLYDWLTGVAYGVGKFLYGAVWIKGIIDQYTQGMQPYDAFSNYAQGGLVMIYGIAGVGWFLTRNTT